MRSVFRALFGASGRATAEPPVPADPPPALVDAAVPALRAEHIAPGARLFASRDDLIRSLAGGRFEAVAEVGVALGDFSLLMIEALRPRAFWAFDVFTMHDYPEHWGRRSTEIFGTGTHLDYYRRRLAGADVSLHIVEGLSGETLPRHMGPQFDIIYIDAAHHYEGVRADAADCARLLAPGGTLVFNDYVLFDPFLRAPYGVVRAVNEMLEGGGWQVTGFAFQRHMFCDIALGRAPA